MVLKLALVPMEQDFELKQDFELNSLDENLKQRMESVHLSSENINCCSSSEQRNGQVNMEQHLQQQQGAVVLQYPGVEMHCPAVGSLPGGGRRAVVLTGSTPGFAPDYHHPSFPPSPPSVAAIPGESPAMQPDGRTNLLEESMQWLPAQPLDLRNSDDIESWMLRRAYGDLLNSPLGIEDHQHVIQQQQQQHIQQPKMNSCMNGYGGSVESVPGSSSSGSFSASDDCDSLTDIPSPSFNHVSNGSNGSPGSNTRSMMRLADPTAEVDGGLNDEQLIALSVRDLNRKLHGYPRDVITRIKQKRRTLKNRGYAQNCRTKRIALKCLLEKNNQSLQMERDRLFREREAERQQKEKAILDRDKAMHDRDIAIQERDFYKQQLKQQLSLARSREFSQQGSLSSTNASSPSSPEFYI
ncbi:hypothetical protein AVEN_124191-1 [Araneus ventricosus]|uniref:Basic leucine zipper domain-containing protein n=1 Tax=Araneus ventricosus TaxID=182803 RepID=A0A4Y2SD20_ARAVE|nr:hypothetical protein AVEN_42022-1 [Araneus ventricosus]GBN85206.1 hypothetical protein AVEN_128837-1 [Araneus ventricosus]GBN85232.1 hypothetical protein AVEN_20846-1 [Araneus ventricosus]GBN85242.1 hypothetical protein AVEN_124191-1 [Araneus ventricosus]